MEISSPEQQAPERQPDAAAESKPQADQKENATALQQKAKKAKADAEKHATWRRAKTYVSRNRAVVAAVCIAFALIYGTVLMSAWSSGVAGHSGADRSGQSTLGNEQGRSSNSLGSGGSAGAGQASSGSAGGSGASAANAAGSNDMGAASNRSMGGGGGSGSGTDGSGSSASGSSDGAGSSGSNANANGSGNAQSGTANQSTQGSTNAGGYTDQSGPHDSGASANGVNAGQSSGRATRAA